MYVTYVVLLGAYYAFVCITAAKVFHLNGCFFAVIVTVRSYGHGWLCHTHLEHGTAESVTRQFSTELVCHALWHLWPFVCWRWRWRCQTRAFQLERTTNLLELCQVEQLNSAQAN